MAGRNTWRFGGDGSLTFPGNLIIGPNPLNPGTVISQANAEITVATTGNAATYIGWSEFEFEPGNIALVAFNDTTGAVAIQTGATTGPEAFNEWIFDGTGNLTLPAGGSIFNSSGEPYVNGVTSISTSVTTGTYSDASGDFSYGLLGYSYAVNGVTNSFEIQYSAPLVYGNVDISVGNVTTTGTANVANLIVSGPAPSTLSGSAGDRAGMVRVDSNYIYYCTSTFASNVYTVGWAGAVSNTLFITQGAYPTPQVGWIVTHVGNNFTIDTVTDDGYGSWQITWVGTAYGSPNGGTATLTNPTPLSAIWKTVPLSAFQTAANATNKLTNGGSEVALQANGVTTFGNTATISNNGGEFRLWADNDITVYRNGQDGYGVKAGSVEIFTNNGQRTVITSEGLEIKTGNLIIPNDKAVVFANGVNILSTAAGTYSNTNVTSYFQSLTSLALGSGAGATAQGVGSVALGVNAGNDQGYYAVAIGIGSGRVAQSDSAVAVGGEAGWVSQGINSVAVGYRAGTTNQANGSIILNATGANLNATTANTFTVAPVRNDVANVAQVMFYNTTSKEITYGNTISIAGNLSVTGNVVQGSAYYETYGNIVNSGGNLTCNFNLGSTFYAALTANVTANFTNVNAITSTVTGATIIVDQGATAYRVANVQVNGVNQTVRWVGASTGVGTASNTDVMSFSLIHLGGGAWRVLGQISNYG
jgi:hypothetical protein